MGNLPYARSADVDDSDPVPSGLLGEIQDSIILLAGPQAIPGSAWQASGSATGWSLQDGVWTYAPAAGLTTLEAPLFVPVGFVVTKIRFAYNRTGGGSASGGLVRVKFSDGTTDQNEIIFTDNTSTGAHTFDMSNVGEPFFGPTAGPLVIQAGYAYTVMFRTNGAGGVTFCGAIINP